MAQRVFRVVRVPALVAAVVAACSTAYYEPAIAPAPSAVNVVSDAELKVHMPAGDLYVLKTWNAEPGVIHGSGVHWNVSRDSANTVSEVSIQADSATLIETNSKKVATNFGNLLIGALVVGEAYITAGCMANPKSCFGSCPTFYVDGDEPDRVRAEGFSESVARVLERRDVDALGAVGVVGKSITIRMRNEAMETHMVRRVRLLVATRPPSGHVFAVGDTGFVAVRDMQLPTVCAARDGDCRAPLAARDDNEWTSSADSTDLANREYVELTFGQAPERPALIVTSRKSLVTTFLFYQTLAYLGHSATDLLARMERGTRAQAEDHFAMARLLGNIEVQIPTDSGWTTVGSVGEAGPIAADTKVLTLPPTAYQPGQPARVRLKMARGNWRLDWVALGALGESVRVERIGPNSVERNGVTDDVARASLVRGLSHIVAMPGDEYALRYDLPADANTLDLFVESEGFYYEWMRREWLAEEDPLLAAQTLADPAGALRRLAPAFSAREASIEKMFWASRFNRRHSDAR
jgi:hypothetical protein